MKLEIKVTKEILRKSMMCGAGTNGSIAQNCAIALAVRDIFPKADVTCINIYPFSYRDRWIAGKVSIPTPLCAVGFIQAFDKLEDKPTERLDLPELTFTVDVPDAVIEKINIDQLRPQLENHPTLKLIES